MKSSSKPPAELLGSRLSTATLCFHSAVAERMGVPLSDIKCCSLLAHHGPQTSGQLARRLSLTTGAVTGVIDRLERTGWVRRVEDPDDRRVVMVELLPNPKRAKQHSALFEPLKRRIEALLARYSKRDQQMLGEFLETASGVLEEEALALRGEGR